MNEPRAICLLSGGLDSATCLAWARSQGFSCLALSFDYGQRHRIELEAAARVARSLGAAQHLVVPAGLQLFGGSALTADISVPKRRSASELSHGIPVTYVPARNLLFLSFAVAWAETRAASDVVIGVNAVDYSGYPDCRPQFIRSFQETANLATKAGVEGRMRLRIHVPLIQLSKAEIIRLGTSLGVDYGLTHSCYDPAPGGRPCRECDACLIRAQGFAAAGLPDPLLDVHL